MHREPEVVDVWYDSGAMPFAQDHHPFATGGDLTGRVPADFICEALDQTRGWFYSLLAESTLLFDETAYRNVVCLGLILDAEGQKMSKSKGNVIEPWVVLDRQGADAFRWYLLTAQSPWDSFRFSLEAVDDAMRRFLLTLWNTHSFLVTYASLPDGWTPGGPPPAARGAASRGPLDPVAPRRDHGRGHRAAGGLRRHRGRPGARGVPRRPQQLVRAHLAPPLLGRPPRRATGRRGSADGDAAFATLHECLSTIALLVAPFCPFVAEEMLRHAGRRPRPVGARERPPGRLARFPATGATPTWRRRWPRPREAVAVGRGARAEAKLKVRQPLAEAVVACPTAVAQQIGSLVDLVAEELNVRSVRFVTDPGELVDVTPQAQLPPPRPALRQGHAGRRRGRRRAGARRDRARARRRRGRGRSRWTARPSRWTPRTCCARPGPPRATPWARTPPWRSGSPPRSPPSCASRRSRARSSTRSRAPAAPPGCGWRSGSACTSTARASPARPSTRHRGEIAAETLATALTVGHGAPFGGIHHEEHVLDGEPVAVRIDRA